MKTKFCTTESEPLICATESCNCGKPIQTVNDREWALRTARKSWWHALKIRPYNAEIESLADVLQGK